MKNKNTLILMIAMIVQLLIVLVYQRVTLNILHQERDNNVQAIRCYQAVQMKFDAELTMNPKTGDFTCEIK